MDNTSRDQVVGAFFGLGVADDMVDDPAVKSGVSDLLTLMIGFIAHHQWSPNDDITIPSRRLLGRFHQHRGNYRSED